MRHGFWGRREGFPLRPLRHELRGSGGLDHPLALLERRWQMPFGCNGSFRGGHHGSRALGPTVVTCALQSARAHVATRESGPGIATAVVDTAVVADMPPPISAVEYIEGVGEYPITGG